MAENFENKPVDLAFIESYLEQFGGGEIKISKQYWNEGIAIIYIQNPAKRNALSGTMMKDFRRCLTELENWPEGKAVILTGIGENFCSGGDLAYARACCSHEEGFYLSAIMQDIHTRLRRLPLVSVALIHGPTLGGGAEVTIFADLIVAADNVKFSFVHGNLGIITSFGGTTRLVELLGERKAMDLLLKSRILDAQQCLDIGLANKIVSTENKLMETLDFLREYLKHHFTVVRAFKKSIYNAATESFEKSLILERALFSNTWRSHVHVKALDSNIKHLKNKI